MKSLGWVMQSELLPDSSQLVERRVFSSDRNQNLGDI